MKSNICSMETDGYGTKKALEELDKLAAESGLNQKNALRLHLLGEEVISLMNSIAGSISAEFWVEFEEGTYQLHLMTKEHLNYDSRKQMQSVSTSGKNEEAKGVLGKIRMAFELCVNGYMEPFTGYDAMAMPGYIPMGSNMLMSGLGTRDVTIWSLNEYTSKVSGEQAEHKEEWDELEKSIIANLADDVSVGIRNKKAEIVISKKFC